jgi:hypothetical protein
VSCTLSALIGLSRCKPRKVTYVKRQSSCRSGNHGRKREREREGERERERTIYMLLPAVASAAAKIDLFLLADVGR